MNGNRIADPRAYMQVAAYVRAQIVDRSLATGDSVPSIGSLVRTTGRSRQTIGKAMRLLEGEGLVVNYAGLGYYVASATAGEQRTSSDGTRCP
ncbi:MAG TPA: GntR family transcriptional regulator [Streptosporangiaceae bacterium]|nr:GntR family transcriptional regulator [Streptosporangiaceae bacterium]